MPKKSRPRDVQLEDLVVHVKCQVREGLNERFVNELAEEFRNGVDVVPIEVVDVDGAHYIVNGHHRKVAAELAGLEALPVIVVGTGDIDFAVWTACAANKDQDCLRRTNADERRFWPSTEVVGTKVIGSSPSTLGCRTLSLGRCDGNGRTCDRQRLTVVEKRTTELPPRRNRVTQLPSAAARMGSFEAFPKSRPSNGLLLA